jgi:hypothetical protein
MIPGIVAAGSWHRAEPRLGGREMLDAMPVRPDNRAMNGLNSICGICREIIR